MGLQSRMVTSEDLAKDRPDLVRIDQISSKSVEQNTHINVNKNRAMACVSCRVTRDIYGAAFLLRMSIILRHMMENRFLGG